MSKVAPESGDVGLPTFTITDETNMPLEKQLFDQEQEDASEPDETQKEKGLELWHFIKYITRFSGLQLPSTEERDETSIIMVIYALMSWVIGVLLAAFVYVFFHDLAYVIHHESPASLSIARRLVYGTPCVCALAMFFLFSYNGMAMATFPYSLRLLQKMDHIPTWISVWNQVKCWVGIAMAIHVPLLVAVMVLVCFAFNERRLETSENTFFIFDIWIYTKSLESSPYYEISVTVEALAFFFVVLITHVIEFWISFICYVLSAYSTELRTFIEFVMAGSCVPEEEKEEEPNVVKDIESLLTQKQGSDFGLWDLADSVATYIENLDEEQKQNFGNGKNQLKVKAREKEFNKPSCCKFHENITSSLDELAKYQSDIMGLIGLAQEKLQHLITLSLVISVVTGCSGAYMLAGWYGIQESPLQTAAVCVFVIAFLARNSFMVISVSSLSRQQRERLTSFVPSGPWTSQPDARFRISMMFRADNETTDLSASGCFFISRATLFIVLGVPFLYYFALLSFAKFT